MLTLSSHDPDPGCGRFPVVPGAMGGGVVALVPHPAGVIVTSDMKEDLTAD